MGKRLRSIGVRFGEFGNDIQLTRHAIERFQQRVAKVPSASVPGEIRRILRTAVPLMRTTPDDCVYLAHELCIVVMTRRGVVTTVLPPNNRHSHMFADGVKSVRKTQRRHKSMRGRAKRK